MLVRPQAGQAGLRVAALPPRGARSRCPALRAVAFLLTYQGRPHNDFLNSEAERQRKAAIYARHARAIDRRISQRRWRRVLTIPVLAIVCILLFWLVSPYAPPALMHA
jgi:hypothetical protein